MREHSNKDLSRKLREYSELKEGKIRERYHTLADWVDSSPEKNNVYDRVMGSKSRVFYAGMRIRTLPLKLILYYATRTKVDGLSQTVESNPVNLSTINVNTAEYSGERDRMDDYNRERKRMV
ncbi:MAG: hypothetical protein AABX49_00395 [Nanoarchaeota archaeon]